MDGHRLTPSRAHLYQKKNPLNKYHFSFGQSNDRHCLRRFVPRPRLLLKFGNMIDVGYTCHVSKFQQQTRSRSKMSVKKLMSNNILAVPHWNTSDILVSLVWYIIPKLACLNLQVTRGRLFDKNLLWPSSKSDWLIYISTVWKLYCAL